MRTTLLAIGAAAAMMLSGCQNDAGMGDTDRTGMTAPREADTANVDMMDDNEDRQEMRERNSNVNSDARMNNDDAMDADERTERLDRDPDDDRREGRVVVPPADRAPSASDSGG